MHHDAYTAGGDLDVEKLLKATGGGFDPELSADLLVVSKPQEFLVNSPFAAGESRTRFTAARALGHYFLHYRQPGKNGLFRVPLGSLGRAGSEASVFALALLLPSESFRRMHTASGGDHWALARHFRVTPDVAQAREEMPV